MRIEQGVKVYDSSESKYKKPYIGEFFVASNRFGLYIYQQLADGEPKRVMRFYSNVEQAIKVAAFLNKEKITNYFPLPL